MKIPEFVWHFKSSTPGPKVVIIGSLHGNERIGAEAIEKLKNDLADCKLLAGEVFLILGNPFAYEQNVRFLEFDMNRLLGKDYSDLETADSSTLAIEQKRVLEIAEIVKDADFLLDIHSTIKPSRAFMYCETSLEHLKLANLFSVDYIVSAASDFRPADLVSSVDNFVDERGGIGLTYEAGWHEDPLKVSEVIKNIKTFLQELDVYDFELAVNSAHIAQQMLIYADVIPQSGSFSFVKDFENFDFVEKGSIIALDGDAEITAKQDSYVVFPKIKIFPGRAACYLACKNQL